jgi:hypothetical protein
MPQAARYRVYALSTLYCAHPRQVAALKANAAREIRSHDFFYTVADLMGIAWPGAKPERSFASQQFIPDTSGKHPVGGALMTRL